jgi:hypothetical protein
VIGDLASNHGGVALVAAPGVESELQSPSSRRRSTYVPTSFEMTCARLTSGCFSGIYRRCHLPARLSRCPVDVLRRVSRPCSTVSLLTKSRFSLSGT